MRLRTVLVVSPCLKRVERGCERKQRPWPLFFFALYLLNDFEQAASPIGRLQDSNQFFREVTRNEVFHYRNSENYEPHLSGVGRHAVSHKDELQTHSAIIVIYDAKH